MKDFFAIVAILGALVAFVKADRIAERNGRVRPSGFGPAPGRPGTLFDRLGL